MNFSKIRFILVFLITCNFQVYAQSSDKSIAGLYDMLDQEDEDKTTVRSVFVIGTDKKIKLMITYPASTGRSFNEILRVIDSLQLTADYQVATPVNWENGEDCIIVPAVSNDEIPEKFPLGHTEIKPYLRYTPQPNR